MKRTFNYTGRKRISKNDFLVTVKRKNNIAERFSVEVNLDKYNFKENCDVYVEAYRHSEIKRFYFGKVSEINEPNTDISDLPQKNILLYNLLIVDNSIEKGRIVGFAKSVKPKDKGYDRESILDVEFDDFQDNLLWELKFDEGGPILRLNRKIDNIKYLARNDPFFIFNVFPAIIRQIMYQLRYVEDVDPDETENQWHNDWVDFLKNHSKKEYVQDIDPEDFDEQIELCISNFVNEKNNLWHELLKIHNKDE